MIRALLSAAALGCAPVLAAGKPNVLLIAVDDLNTRLGCYGDPVVKTPHIDRLAAKGVRFDRAYCQLPWCNPSRTSFLSGLRPEGTRVMGNGTLPDAYLKDAVAFLPAHLKANGYWTARAGKIFHDTPEMQTWVNAPRFWDVADRGKGAWPKDKVAAHKVFHGRGTRVDFLQYTSYDAPEEGTPEYALGTRGVELIRQGAKAGKPFFVGVGFHKPHLAWTAPKKYFDLYDPATIPLTSEPPLADQDIPLPAGGGNTKTPPLSDDDRKEAVAAYYACTSYVDTQVGRLLAALDEQNLWGNTVVIFLGDHGYSLGEHHGAWEKMNLWDESCRAPLIVAAPGAAGNGHPTRRIVELVDIYPTVVDLCGLPKPVQQFHGTTLRPLLAVPAAAWDRPAYTLVPYAQKSDGPAAQVRGRSVRTERWRYTEWGDNGPAQLFDHDADPHEFKNLAADPAHRDTVAELKRTLADLRKASTK